jgi:predicted RNase H-like nuclease (RuvC/YqgF family)
MMKFVFIAGSRKYYDEIEELVGKLKEAGIEVSTAGKIVKEEDTLESERAALLRAFGRIQECDLVYVYSKQGYVGKTVAMEIAYAYAKGKEIISLEEVEELSARGLVDKIVDIEGLVEYCK